MSTITEQLKQLIANDLDLNVDINTITDEMSLLENGIGLDSMAGMEFVSLIEAKFSIEFTDEELSMEPFENLAALSQCIAEKNTA
jgi:acyl carrier protein